MNDDPDAAELAREIERVSDRLRVLGPRLAARLPAGEGASAAHPPGSAAAGSATSGSATSGSATSGSATSGSATSGSAASGSAASGSATAEAVAARARIRGVLQTLADLAADAQGLRRRRVPELAPHGWGDQVLVLGHDLLTVTDRGARAAGLQALTGLRRAL